MTLPPPQSHDESGGDSTDLEDASRLWPTFAALFLLTLLYSGFVTFIKVRQPAPLCAGLSPETSGAPSLHLHIPTAGQRLAACSHLTWLGRTRAWTLFSGDPAPHTRPLPDPWALTAGEVTPGQ